MGGTEASVRDEPADVRAEYGVAADAVCLRLFNFTTGDATLQRVHQEQLSKRVVHALGKEGQIVYVVGHASRAGASAFNQKLSESRAFSVWTYLRERVDVSHSLIEVYGRGETRNVGRGDNDPIDRAVVVVVQDAHVPRPRILPIPPDLPPPPPHLPDPPPLVAPQGFRPSGWMITGAAGAGISVPALPALNVGLEALDLTLENRFTRETAQLKCVGLLGSVATVKVPRFPKVSDVLKRMSDVLKGLGFSVGPASFPTFGSEIFVTPWVPEPVPADTFQGFVLMSSLNAAFGPGASGNVIFFTMTPAITGVGPILAGATTKGIGVFLSTGLSAGLSADIFNARADLGRVVKPL